ncbi:MAG: hypothetical protein R3C68_07440 [Myxococcota bacterium]
MGATLIDLGDGVVCLRAHTKMNTIDAETSSDAGTVVEEAEKNFQAIVVGNQGEHFCAGANLLMVFMAAQRSRTKSPRL